VASVTSFTRKHRIKLIFWLLLALGLIIRTILVPYSASGDLLIYQEWGTKFWELGARNYYFSEVLWKYAPPNYPPLASLLFGGSYWLFEHKFWFAQLHNLIKIPPAFFIIYFYEYGYLFLLKLPSILADLGLGVIVYSLVLKFTKKPKTALIALAVFVLNPVTIFISSVWGQTDSLVSFFGMMAFLLLLSKKQFLSLPFLFISLYLKPSWAIFVPLYLFLIFHHKIRIRKLLIGAVVAFVVFLLATYPFSGNDVLGFTIKLFSERLPIAAKVDTVASVSAFNFHSFFLQIDRDFSSTKLLGISAKTIGLLAYLFLNIFSFLFIAKQKDKLLALITGIFVIGFGSFLFLTGMLERYFFVGFAPLIILLFTHPKILAYGLLINFVVMANIIWSFFRRKYDEVDRPFTNSNFFLIRTLSLVCLFGWASILKHLKIFKR
jgi:Gpi18-like mannosyltransferase